MLTDSTIDPAALRAARLRAGLTQHQLARLIGVAGGERVSRWELGRSTPRLDILGRIVQVLDLGNAALLAPASGPADLRRLRLLAGLSVRELAVRAITSAATVQRWETGQFERMPARAALSPVAAALKVPVGDVELALAQSKVAARQAK